MSGGGGPAQPPLRRGLVIGAGAAVGGAWALGALCALAETELFSPSLDLVVGTSAGSVLAALISHRVALHVMVQTLTGEPPGSLQGEGVARPERPDGVHRMLTDIPRAVPLPGNLRLAARALARTERRSMWTAAAALAPRGRGDLAPVGDLVQQFCGDPGWSGGTRTWLVAMDYDSGRRVAFGAPGEPAASMADAVMASCSVPGYFPPRQIGSRRYVDGGAVSVTNADLLTSERLDEVVVLAPMAMHDPSPRGSAVGRLDHRLRRYATRRLQAEVALLRATGTGVRVLAPTEDDLHAMGPNSFDASRRRSVFETALRTTASRLGERPEAERDDTAEVVLS